MSDVAEDVSEGSATGEDTHDEPSIEISADEAAAFAEVASLLLLPVVDDSPRDHADADGPSIEALLIMADAPLSIALDANGGHCMIAARGIAKGEQVLVEEATAWFVARAPGGDGLYSISDRAGTLLTTLPVWAALRTLRDTLTLAPRFVGRAADAWRLLSGLLTTGGPDEARSDWASVPTMPPGVPILAPGGGSNVVPPRAQLLGAIAQVNAFSAALPAEDTPWRRSILWPTLCRITEASDRDRLWDDDEPLSHVSAIFPLAAQFNHGCGTTANIRYTCTWAEGEPAARITFVAARDIACGEEMLHDYTGGLPDPCSTRRRKLLLSHRFLCHCAVCAAELAQAGADDPLKGAFSQGTGLSGTTFFFAAGGRYPPT